MSAIAKAWSGLFLIWVAFGTWASVRWLRDPPMTVTERTTVWIAPPVREVRCSVRLTETSGQALDDTEVELYTRCSPSVEDPRLLLGGQPGGRFDASDLASRRPFLVLSRGVTNEDGVVTWGVREDWFGDPSTELPVHAWCGVGESAWTAEVVLSPEVLDTASDEVHELGTWRLEPAPLLCAGTVVDDRGEPVAGARLEWPPRYALEGLEPSTIMPWFMVVICDSLGRFECYGRAPAGEHLAECASEGHATVSSPLVAGSLKTRIVLPCLD